MYTFPFCRLKNDRITAILSARLTVLCRFAPKIGCASAKLEQTRAARTNNRNKNQNWMDYRIEVSGANTNNRNKNQNWMDFRIEVSGANINNRNSVA